MTAVATIGIKVIESTNLLLTGDPIAVGGVLYVVARSELMPDGWELADCNDGGWLVASDWHWERGDTDRARWCKVWDRLCNDSGDQP